MTIFQVSKSLGLPVELKPVCKEEYGESYVLPSFGFKRDVYYDSNEVSDDREFLESVFEREVMDHKNVHWCLWSEVRSEPIVSGIHYGNDATSLLFYQSAALLVKVPEFTSERGRVTSALASDAPSVTKKTKEESPAELK